MIQKASSIYVWTIFVKITDFFCRLWCNAFPINSLASCVEWSIGSKITPITGGASKDSMSPVWIHPFLWFITTRVILDHSDPCPHHPGNCKSAVKDSFVLEMRTNEVKKFSLPVRYSSITYLSHRQTKPWDFSQDQYQEDPMVHGFLERKKSSPQAPV